MIKFKKKEQVKVDESESEKINGTDKQKIGNYQLNIIILFM